eukprot:jgi/Psemu1/5186/gm1.5186_g
MAHRNPIIQKSISFASPCPHHYLLQTQHVLTTTNTTTVQTTVPQSQSQPPHTTTTNYYAHSSGSNLPSTKHIQSTNTATQPNHVHYPAQLITSLPTDVTCSLTPSAGGNLTPSDNPCPLTAWH